MTTFDKTVRRPYLFSLSVLFLLSAATTVTASPQHCSDAPSIGPGETLRGEGLKAGEPDCFRLQPPAAGLLMLDLTVPGTAVAEPRLGLLGPRAARVKVIEQSASHLLVASDARELTVCAGAQDPRAALGKFQLRTAFVELDPRAIQKAEQIEVDPDPFAGCLKAEQIEVDPDPFAGCLKAEQIEVDPDPFAGCLKAEQIEVDPDPFAGCLKAEQIEVDPDPFAGCLKAEQIEVDPDPLAGSNPLAELCSGEGLDDHADRLLCATAIELDRSTEGMIDNGWGDDHDVFVFMLHRTRTVQLETAGEVDTFGGLYDRRGQRLAATGGGGDGANFRLVKTLTPGLYFVRVEAENWSRGAYALTVGALERSW